MTLLRAFDCWGVPSGAEIKAAGYEALGLYIPFAGDQGKSPTRANLEDLTANGIYWWWIWERLADDPAGGVPQAEADFSDAVVGLEQLGIPRENVVVYFTNDAVITYEQAFMAYFEEIGRLAPNEGIIAGIYADVPAIDWVSSFIPRYFQTGAGSEPPGVSPIAHIYQGAPGDEYGYPQFTAFGRTCDADGIFKPDWGGMNLNGPWEEPPVATPYQDVTVYVGTNGEGQANTQVPFSKALSAQPLFGEGTKQKGEAGMVELLNGNTGVDVYGWQPNSTIKVRLAYNP